jgi:hypothetical protein
MSNYFKQINYEEEEKMTDYDAEESIRFMTESGFGFVCEQNDEGEEIHRMSKIVLNEYRKNRKNWLLRNGESIAKFLNNFHQQLCVDRQYKYTITIEINTIPVFRSLNKDDIYNYFTDNEEEFNNSNMYKTIYIKFKLIEESEKDDIIKNEFKIKNIKNINNKY